MLDEHTLHEHVAIPAHLQQHLRAGAMSQAHFSDYLRTCLLLRHGGIWLDATVYLSGPLPPAFTAVPFFCYRSALFCAFPGLPPFKPSPLCPPLGLMGLRPAAMLFGSSWALAAAPGCRLLALLRHLLEAYWQRERGLIDYFLYHYMLTWLLYRDPGCAQLYLSMPALSNLPPHLMQSQLLRPYDPQLQAAICAATAVHKLTYKYETQPQASGLTLHHLLGEGGTA